MADTAPHPLSLTGRPWIWPAPGAVVGPSGTDMPPWVRALLHARGVTSDEAVRGYLEPSLSMLADPLTMADMPRAVERLLHAIRTRELVTVYGDYDVDGVCSTALLVEFLRQVGAEVRYYIPDRRAEGYGLNPEAVRQIAAESHLLVTTDTGVSANAEIALARDLGLDTVVVDHHQVPSELPCALATLDPHRPDCSYAFKGLCAAGVAFMLVVALRRALRDSGHFGTHDEPDVRALLDLVAVATVADMVPIRDTNRVLVAAGLKRLRTSPREGLRALMAVCKVEPALVTATDLGFRLGPRINARGRLDHAAAAVDLMLTRDAPQAKALAATLDAANLSRREIEKRTLEEAIVRVEAGAALDGAGLVLFDATWHPGVLGLVASRLASRFHRPAVVIGEGGKGSARGVAGLDLHASIAQVSTHLVRFGGHRAAAGVTLDPAQLDAFRDAWVGEVEQRLGRPPYVAPLRPDLEITVSALSLATVAQLDRLEPFGQENPPPLFVSRGLPITRASIVGNSHLKLTIGGDHDAIGFGLAGLASQLPKVVDAAFRLQRNRYRGLERLQLELEDVRPSA
ncbi:MAG: single-stranded-DNA-specific exonuclease RecJ [Myxococcota bacterium]